MAEAKPYIDHSVYPDLDQPPTELATIEDQADYVQRICAAWDFGVCPEEATFDLLRGWREVFDRFPLLASPAYHALRMCYRWPPVPVPTWLRGPEPRWVKMDRLEGRGPDPCEDMV